MRLRISQLITWRGSLDRGPYIIWAVLLCALKYNLDRFLVWQWTGERWSLLDYTKVGKYLWPRIPHFDRPLEFAGMLALAAPFMAVGVLLTVKRLRSANLHPALVLLFFVPVLKFALFVLLSLIPAREQIAVRHDRDENLKSRLGLTISARTIG